MKSIVTLLFFSLFIALPLPGAAQIKMNCITVGPNNSYAIIYNKNAYSYRQLPVSLGNKITELNKAGNDIKQVVLNKDGSWIVLFDFNGYSYYGNISEGLIATIKGYWEKKENIKHIAIAPNGGYIVLSDRNAFSSRGIPDDLYQQLLKFNKDGEEIKKVIFGSNSSYIVLRDSNGFWKSGISTELSDKMWAVNRAKGYLNDIVLTENGYILNSGDNEIECRGISDNMVNSLREIVSTVNQLDGYNDGRLSRTSDYQEMIDKDKPIQRVKD